MKQPLAIELTGKKWSECSLEEQRRVRLAYKRTSDAKHYNKRYDQSKAKYKTLLDLKGGKCQVCHYDANPAALDFHHRNPETKKFNVGLSSMQRSMKTLLVEVEKCDLVCCRCHREIHYPL